MAWNEPGSGKHDPWGGSGGSGGGKNQGPPDLDEVIAKLQQRMGSIFGRKGGGDGEQRGAGREGPNIGVLLLFAVGAWLIYDMVYFIEPAERGVVLRFGSYVATMDPGPNIRMPRPFESVIRVNVDQIRNAEIGYRAEGQAASTAIDQEALMLTRDENIVDVKLAVQYKIKNANEYLFYLTEPDLTLREVTESVLREIVGKNKMDFVLTEGRREIAERVRENLQTVLDGYKSGLLVTSVNLQDAQPPEQVQHAFADAVKAREDEQRLKNEAETYSNDIIPKARGAAARQIEEANAYKSRVVAEAEGASSRFNNVLTQYVKAPKVTRERIYLDTMQSVLTNSSKVFVNVKGGNNMIYLPLDRYMKQGQLPQSNQSLQEGVSQDALKSAVAASADKPLNNGPARENMRLREVR